MVHFIFKHHAQLLILCLQGLGVHINYNALECCASTYLLSVLPNYSFRRLAQSPAELRGFVSLCSPLALEFKCFPALVIETVNRRSTERSAVSEPRWLPNFVLYKFIAIKVIFSRIFPLWDQKGNRLWLMMLSI